MVFDTTTPYIDCFAPTLGHTALRCVGFDDSQARWLMLPATIYFLSSLVMALNWIRLILARRDIRSQHFCYLFLHGLLVFALATADYTHRVDQPSYSSSRSIGGLSVLTTITLICSITTFLPPREALKMSLDRGLTATGFAAALEVLLASVSRFTPDGLNTETRNIFYAAGACMLCFLLFSLLASQQSRFFALPNNFTGDYHVFVSLGWKSNAVFVVALIFLLIQTPFAFIDDLAFSHLMAASMMGAIGYALLVATSVVAHYHASMFSTMQTMPRGREKELTKRKEEDFHIEGDLERNVNGSGLANDHHDVDQARLRRSLQVPAIAHTNSGHEQLSNRSNRGSVIWKGDAVIAPRMQVQSGVSAASWDRLEQIMQARRRAQSNLTYYGSEQSYAHQEGAQTRPTSVLTSAGLASFFGIGGQTRQAETTVPPVPAIDSRYLASEGKQTEIVVAKPLTEGEVPIVLSPVPINEAEQAGGASTQKVGLKNIPGMLWSGLSTSKKPESGNKKRDTYAPSTIDKTLQESKERAYSLDTTSRASNNIASPSADHNSGEMESIRGLAMRYSSTKLFPSPMTATTPTASGGRNANHDVQTTTQYATRHADDSLGSVELAAIQNKHQPVENDEHVNKRATTDSADEGKKVSEKGETQVAHSPVLVSPSRKVNRGKVIRKTDVAEDQGPRMTTAILFPGPH